MHELPNNSIPKKCGASQALKSPVIAFVQSASLNLRHIERYRPSAPNHRYAEHYNNINVGT